MYLSSSYPVRIQCNRASFWLPLFCIFPNNLLQLRDLCSNPSAYLILIEISTYKVFYEKKYKILIYPYFPKELYCFFTVGANHACSSFESPCTTTRFIFFIASSSIQTRTWVTIIWKCQKNEENIWTGQNIGQDIWIIRITYFCNFRRWFRSIQPGNYMIRPLHCMILHACTD